MSFSLTRLVAPTREPLTLDEVKEYLRIIDTSQDNVVTMLITAARTQAEQYLRRALLPQQWRLTLDRFPGSWPYTYGYGQVQSPKREIHLPICPLISVDSIEYPDPSTLAPVALTDYQVVYAEPGRIQPAYGTAWPSAACTVGDIHIDFTAGYQDVETSPAIGSVEMPEQFKVAMLWMIGHWYENRESQDIPPGATNLLQPYRVWDVAPVASNFDRFPR